MKHWISLLKKKKYTLFAVLAISLCMLTIIALSTIFSPILLKEEDITAPVMALKDDSYMIISYGSTFIDPGVSATDDVDGNLTASVTVTGSINTQIYGKQYLTYSVSDAAGNTQTIQRTVVVQEFTPPVLSLTGSDKLYVPVGSSLNDPGFTATDDIDGDITASVVLSDTVDYQTPGTYTLNYTATDSSGNSTVQSRTIYVFQPQSAEQAANPPGKVVYLTFDDGPGEHTQKLLDILDKYNVDVTFFVTGQYADYHYLIGEAHRRGHTIALHTYSHKFHEIYTSESAYYYDLSRISAICEAQTGEKASIIRFPGGTSNTISKKYCPGIMTALTQSLTTNGYQYCDWNVDSNDAGGASTSTEVAANVIRDIQKFSRSVVLQHDTKLYSVEAVEEIIYWGLMNGYTFLPLTPDTPMSHHKAYN